MVPKRVKPSNFVTPRTFQGITGIYRAVHDLNRMFLNKSHHNNNELSCKIWQPGKISSTILLVSLSLSCLQSSAIF